MTEQELELDEAKGMELDGKAMERLLVNRDFKRVFTSPERGLLKSGAIELVELMANPSVPKEMHEENAKRLYAISFLGQYINTMVSLGADASAAINQDEDA